MDVLRLGDPTHALRSIQATLERARNARRQDRLAGPPEFSQNDSISPWLNWILEVETYRENLNYKLQQPDAAGFLRIAVQWVEREVGVAKGNCLSRNQETFPIVPERSF